MEQIKEVLKCPSPTRSCQSCSLSLLGFSATLPAAFPGWAVQALSSAPQDQFAVPSVPTIPVFVFVKLHTTPEHFHNCHIHSTGSPLPWSWQQSCSLHPFMPHLWLLNPIPPWKRHENCARATEQMHLGIVCGISSSHTPGWGWMNSNPVCMVHLKVKLSCTVLPLKKEKIFT